MLSESAAIKALILLLLLPFPALGQQTQGAPGRSGEPASVEAKVVEAEPVAEAPGVDADSEEAPPDAWGMKGEAPPADDWGALRKEAAAPKTPGYVTNFFYDTPIRDALSEMAMQADTTIVADQSVQGLVTCDLKDVPLEEALRIVLAIGNYTYRDMDGFILVGLIDPESPSFSRLSEVRTITLNYAKAEGAVKVLPAALQKFTTFHEQTNSVIATGPASLLDQVEALLKQVDVAPRQVMLEARIVVIESVNLLNLGTKWTWPTLSAGTFSNSELHGSQQPAVGPSWPWGIQLGYTPGKEFTEALLLTLNLLSQNNLATVIANPKVMVQSGETAEISAKTEEYFEILTQGIYTRSELEKIEAGTTLEITPTITANGEITLVIRTEVSDVVARGKNNLPVVTRRTTSGTVRVQDGGTVVVAGLTLNRTSTDRQEIPGIGKVPVLGRLFRNNSSKRSSRQLLVFVTPRLLEDGGKGDMLRTATSSSIRPVRREFQNDLRKALEERGKRKE